MILFFQLPLTDIRGLTSENTWRITAPPWPRPIFSASNGKQDWFVRQFGKIKPRRRGGITGWLGEDEICDAKNAMKILAVPSFICKEQELHIQGIARHFFFDGNAVGKYEFVFATTQGNHLSSISLADFMNHFLNLQVAPAFNKKLITPLYLAGGNLSKEYLLSTTKTKKLNGITGYWINHFRDFWINSGSNLLYIECKKEETDFPLGVRKDIQIKKIPLPAQYNADLFHVLHPIDNRFIRTWILKRNDNSNAEKLRTLRLYVMRLNSEYESIKYILSQIHSGNIRYRQGQKENPLETYLNEATRHITRIENKAKFITDTDEIEDLSKLSFDKAYPGSADSVLTKIRSIRPQIYKKVEKLVQEIYNIKGDYVMGDNINFNGNFQGANINVKSDLTGAIINIQNASMFDQSTKYEIEKTLNQLDDELQKVSKENQEEVEAISSTAKHLVETAAKEKPNKTEVKISADGLLKAAENIAKIAPVVMTLAKHLIDLIVK